MSLAILGQSNASNLWSLSGISTLSATLNSLTNKTVPIIQGAVGGSSLLKATVNSGTPHNFWLDRYDTTSPIYAFLQNDFSTLSAVLWVQGEQDANVGTSVETYLDGLLELQAIIAAAAGKQTKDLPFVIAPLGNAAKLYTNGWKIRNAHFLASHYPGFVIGPEYIDLAVESDNIHLTAASRETFATRAATVLAPIIGAGTGVYNGSFTRDISLASGSQTIGLPFTPSRVDFSASLPSSPFTSRGTDSGSAASCDYTDGAAGGSRTDASIYIFAASSGNGYKGSVTTFPSKAFTVSWTKIGSGAGTSTVNFTAFL